MARHVAISSLEGTPPGTGHRSFPALLTMLRANFYLGRMRVGDRLPPVRELARHLHVSPTTALDFYKRLEEEGIVEGRQRSGTFLRQVGIGAEDGGGHAQVFEAIVATARRLEAAAIPPEKFAHLLLRYVGAVPRDDFKFGFVSHRESFQNVERQVHHRLKLQLPIVWLSPDAEREPAVRAELVRDRSIKCLVTTCLYAQYAAELARDLGRTSTVVQLDPETAQAIEPPEAGIRYIVTRDADFADGLRRLTGCVYGGARAAHLFVAAIGDGERMPVVDRDAETVYASPMCLRHVVNRYAASKRVLPLPGDLSQGTIDGLLFQYTFG